MKGVMMIVGIVLLAVIVGAAVAFRLYWRHNTHWFDKYEKALKVAGAEEKQVTLPNGNVINYGLFRKDEKRRNGSQMDGTIP